MEDSPVDGQHSIMQLPDDCLCLIFHWLDCGTDRESFGLTCRRWLDIQNLSRHSLQFQCSFTQLSRSSLSQPNLNIRSFHLCRLLTRFQHLNWLSLSGCTELPDSSLNQLQTYGSKLQSLYLDCCFQITDNGLSMIATGCSSLTSISLYRCNITDVGLETLANSCSTLMHVNLSHCLHISDHGLKVLSRRCGQLRAVKISSCRGVTGIGFNGCSPTLAYIDAESCQLRPEGITGMVSGGGLEFLNISGMSSTLFGGGLSAIGTGLGTRLKTLNLRMCRNVGDVSIVAIAKGCPLLQEWNLSLCHEVRLPGWASIGLNCNKLEKLHVNRCRNLCDRGLQALRNGCKQLFILYVNKNARVSSTALELFKIYRGNVEIKDEEAVCIGPDWISR